jgi:hypothetical protein
MLVLRGLDLVIDNRQSSIENTAQQSRNKVAEEAEELAGAMWASAQEP